MYPYLLTFDDINYSRVMHTDPNNQGNKNHYMRPKSQNDDNKQDHETPADIVKQEVESNTPVEDYISTLEGSIQYSQEIREINWELE